MGWGGGSLEASMGVNGRDNGETADRGCGSWKLQSGWKKISGHGEPTVGFSKEAYPYGSKAWRGPAKVNSYWTYLALHDSSPRSYGRGFSSLLYLFVPSA